MVNSIQRAEPRCSRPYALGLVEEQPRNKAGSPDWSWEQAHGSENDELRSKLVVITDTRGATIGVLADVRLPLTPGSLFSSVFPDLP